MKKLNWLLPCLLAIAMHAQDTVAAPGNPAEQSAPQGTVLTSASFPVERVQMPTSADLYCAGYITKQLVPNAHFVAGGLDTPSTTKYENGDIIYLAGGGYQTGQEYAIIRELRDPNRYEMFAGQFAMLRMMGQPYSELAKVRVIDTRHKMAIAQVEFSCDPVNPGDLAVPFVEKAKIPFRPPVRFDRFLPPNDKASGRIVMAKDFDSELGPGMKVYMNVGSNQGVQVGNYFRAVRSYTADLHNPVDSLSFKASTAEDTQKHQPSIDQNMFTKNSGPTIHVADLPRRAVGEVVIIGTTPNTSTGMIVFAMEDVHVGDGVELDPQ